MGWKLRYVLGAQIRRQLLVGVNSHTKKLSISKVAVSFVFHRKKFSNIIDNLRLCPTSGVDT